MDLTNASCGLCHSPYNQTNRLPRILISCGDTLCTACILGLLGTQKFFECPFDKTRSFMSKREIDTFPPNSALVRLMERVPREETAHKAPEGKKSHELCREHGEEMRLFCMEDRCTVCEECLEHGHKGHYVKSMKKIRTEAADEAKRLESVAAVMAKYQSELNTEVSQEKTQAVTETKRRFEEKVQALEKMESQVIKGIEKVFEKEKHRIYIGTNLKRQIIDRILQLDNVIKLKDLSSMKEEKIDYDIDKNITQKRQEDLRDTVKSISDSISQATNEQANLILRIGLAVKESEAIPGPSIYQHKKLDNLEKNNTIEDQFKIENKQEDLASTLASVHQLLAGEKADSHSELREESKTSQGTSFFEIEDEYRNQSEIRESGDGPQSYSSITNEKFVKMEEDDTVCCLDRLIMNKIREDEAKTLDKTRTAKETGQFLQRKTLIEDLENKLELQSTEEIINRNEPIQQDKIFQIEKQGEELVIQVLSPDSQPKKKSMDLDKLKHENNIVLQLGKGSVTRGAASELSAIWKQLGDITSLKLNYSSESASDTQMTPLFPIIFSKREKLSRVEINLAHCPIGDQSLSMLCRDFLYPLRNLTTLRLNFKATNITDSSIEVFAKNALVRLAGKLREFELDISRTVVTNRSVSKLFTEMPKLRTLVFSAAGTAVGDVILAALVAKTLHSAQNLEDLELYLSETRITDHGLGFFACSTEKMKKFKFDMGHNSITDKGMSVVAKSIVKNRNALEELGLWLNDTRATGTLMWASLTKMSAIKKFSLDLRHTVTEDDLVGTVAKRMRDMVNLEDVELYLGNTKVKDNGVSQLFKMMKRLRRLHLDLFGTQVSKISLEWFFKQKEVIMKRDYEYFEMDLEKTRVDDGLKNEVETMKKKGRV